MADINSNDAMLDVFIYETSQLLEQLEQIVLSCESRQYYSEEDINEIFRIMHTIKGSSSMMRYNGISSLSHAIEDLFSYIRGEKPDKFFCPDLNDLILDCVDFIKVELEKIRNRDNPDGDASGLANKIENLLSELKEKGFTGIYNNNNDGNDEEKQINFFKAVLYFEEGCEMENIRAFAVVHNLKKSAEEVVFYPLNIMDDDSSAGVIRREGFQIYIKTDRTQDEIYDLLMQTVFLKELELTEIDGGTFSRGFVKENEDSGLNFETSGVQAEVPETVGNDNEKYTRSEQDHAEEEQKHQGAEYHGASSTQSYISVSVAKLDRLMDLVGEMVIAEAMVIQNPDLEGLELSNFHKAASQLSKLTSEIQDIVMSVRMVPLSATFQRMHRIVRDMCRKLDKDVHLEIIGEETADSLNEIVSSIDEAYELISQIARASDEQSSGINQINQGIAQVSDVVQNNSATAEESASASKELASQAELLKEMVGRFKLKKTVRNDSEVNKLSPEVLEMIKSMIKKDNYGSEDKEESNGAGQPDIVLNDTEFGKY